MGQPGRDRGLPAAALPILRPFAQSVGGDLQTEALRKVLAHPQIPETVRAELEERLILG